METITQYFQHPDTPSEHSPIGVLLIKVLQKYPGMDYETARAKAKELLSTAAKGRIYRTPRVLSASELADRAERLKKAFPKPQRAALVA